MTARSEVRCRWCAWARPAYWKNAQGQSRSGVEALRSHVEDAHPDEFSRIERWARETTAAKLPPAEAR